MSTAWGNQHESRKAEMLGILRNARNYLDHGMFMTARMCLDYWRELMQEVPASTRRRWRCGR